MGFGDLPATHEIDWTLFAIGADGKLIKDSSQGTQLGPVGGRFQPEVFFGLLDSDASSYFQDKSWIPVVKPGASTLTLWDLLSFGGSL